MIGYKDHKEPLTLGELLHALMRREQAAEVVYDFLDFVPTSIGSYRGYHGHAALGYAREHQDNRTPPTVSQLAAELGRGMSEEFFGWSGGRFRYSQDTPLWVSNPGECYYMRIIGLDLDGGTVILCTARNDAP